MAETMRVPDVIGEAVGWRAWQLVGSYRLPRLMSVTYDVAMWAKRGSPEGALWSPDRYTYAVCPQGHGPEDGIPVEWCSCGLYAARDREQLVRLGYGDYSTPGEGIRVIGEVAFSGKVIPGSQGWRAERGRVKSLIVPYEHWRWCAALERTYRVPVTVGFLFKPEVRQRAS